MIYCPECGTANRDGSKFCNECGHTLLAQTGVKCPHCDTLNAVQSVFCSHCGGRLLGQPLPVPSTITPPIKGLSLPTKPLVGEGEEQVEHPSTEGLGVPPVSTVEPLLGSSRPGDVGEPMEQENEEIPDWLRDLQASLPIEPEAEELEPERRSQASIAQPSQPPTPPMPSAKEEGLPSWLAELKPLAEEQAPAGPSVEAESEAEGKLPSWLADLKPLAEEEAPTGRSVEAEPEAEEELPSWLAELKPLVEEEAPTGPSAKVEPEAEAELPSWLAELKPLVEEEAPTGPSAKVEPEVEEELASWLAELKPPAEEQAPTSPSVEAELEAEEAELPSWLAALQPPAAAEASVPQPLAGVEAPLPPPEAELEEGELPPWLAELKEASEPLSSIPEVGPEAEEAATIGSASGGPLEEAALGRQKHAEPEAAGLESALPAAAKAPEAQSIPGWLSELAVAQTPPEAARAEEELPDWLVPTPEWRVPGEEEALAHAEIPDWLLALKPQELKTEGEVVETAVEEAVEQTGVLAGIRDVLPVEMLIAQPRAATVVDVMETRFTGEAALAQASRVRLFDEIVTQPPVVAPAPLARPRSRLIDRLPWWITCALLILAVGVPLLLDQPLVDRSIEASPSVKALYEAIESLPGNAQVLVAVDYDPSTSGEMDIVAQSIVGHLMDRQAQIVTVSLLPAGPATAENVVKEAAAGYSDYLAGDGRRYVNLGYLPGQAAAVRLMGESLPDALPRDFEGRQVTELAALGGITSTQSFDLIVELAAASDTLQWWIEQAAAPYSVSMVAGVSASVEPIARTYYETDPQQLKGVTGGVPGAASYESLHSGGAGLEPQMAARLDSLLAGQVLVILVILAGTIVGRNRIRSKGVGQRGMGRER
jgi:Double zinc ribbon